MDENVNKPFEVNDEILKALAEIERLVPDEEDPLSDPPFCLKDGTSALGFPYPKCSGCPAYSFCEEWHNTYFDALKKEVPGLSIQNSTVTLKDNEEPIEVDGQRVEPLFQNLWETLHPALDFSNGVGYVGVDLPCKVSSTKKNGEEVIDLKTMHFLISSDHRSILCNEHVLTNEGIKLAQTVVELPLRWSLSSIENWLKGKATVDPSEVYNSVKSVFTTYMEFEDARVYDLLTLWSIGTYFFPLFESYPYLYIGGIKHVGKTKLLTLLSFLCFNAIFSGNMSTSSLFRLVQSGRCTVLLDETERLANPEKAEEFRSLLLNGYKRGGVVFRTNKDTGRPEAFEVYSPKALANIRGLEDVLEDRCISIIVKRGKNVSILNSEPKHESPIWQQIRDMLYIFSLERFSAVCDNNADSDVYGERLTGRDLEIWKPILTLAKYFDQWFKGLHDEMVGFALEKRDEKLVENITETGEYLLVQALLNLVKADDYYSLKSIKIEMEKLVDEPQKWLDNRWIGRALKRLGFNEKRKIGTVGKEYRLSPQAVTDLAERLNIPVTPPSRTYAQTSQASQTALEQVNSTGECVVCHRPGGLAKVRDTGVFYLHPECEKNYEGRL